MVNQYIPWFQTTLKKIYPNIDDGVSQALAFGGLTQAMAFSISSYSSRADFLKGINDRYKNGSNGTPCHK